VHAGAASVLEGAWEKEHLVELLVRPPCFLWLVPEDQVQPELGRISPLPPAAPLALGEPKRSQPKLCLP